MSEWMETVQGAFAHSCLLLRHIAFWDQRFHNIVHRRNESHLQLVALTVE